MKVLFVENKHMTRTWESLAPRLEARGHEVHWLVQNPRYRPKAGRVHTMPFPQDVEQFEDRRLVAVAIQDRGVQYFDGSAGHYPHYMRQVEAVLDIVEPDVVIGEPTLFHERLAIEACRSRGLPYYFPCTVRYPSSRFGFHHGDTQRLEHGSAETASDAELGELLALYRARKNPPMFYSKPKGRWGALIHRLTKDVEATLGWLVGERFNTPAPMTKIRLELAKSRRLKRWDSIASLPRARGRREVLFPLQMLPESNLELYGSDYADQLAVLRRMLDASAPDVTFCVKANPVPRYEVTDAWVAFAAAEPRVRLAPLDAPMDDLFWSSDLIVTATGSVAIEAFMTGRPFVTFVESPVTAFAPHTVVSPDGIGEVIAKLDAGDWPTLEAGAAFLQRQFSLSHDGIVADTYNFPEVTAPANLERLARAFDTLAEGLDPRGGPSKPSRRSRENV